MSCFRRKRLELVFPIPRRRFLAAVSAGLSTIASQVFADETKAEQLRVIAYNLFGGTGWPKDRRLAQQAVASGQMVAQLAVELSLHEPDIINFSESPSEEFVKQLADRLAMNYVRFPSGDKWPGTLLSRFEIIDSQNVPLGGERPKELFTRHWGRATIKVSSGEPLIVHSAHLNPMPDPTIRLREIAAMLDVMRADLAAGRSMLLIGDLNHGPDSQEYRRWMSAGWVDTFAKVGRGRGLTMRSDIPRWRIDYVMAAGPMADQIAESKPIFEGAFRLNIADKQAFALSDHLPQLAVFQTNR